MQAPETRPKLSAMERRCSPELLDDMDPADPEAIRSREDLRRINFLMGNERWILREIGKAPDLARHGIVEWGAGWGALSMALAEKGPVTAIDLIPKPTSVSAAVNWRSGDVLSDRSSGGILVASLFLHHFDAEQLARLGERMHGFKMLCFVEPLRTAPSLALGNLMLPFVNRVTRHDMIVSIHAGFIRGELPALLGLDPDQWHISESCSWRGSIRVLASRR